MERGERLRIWVAAFATELELARREPAVVADRGRVRTSSRIFFESSVVISGAISTKSPPDERADVLERRERLLLGPVVQAAGPEVVVLVEVLLLALREVVAAALEPLLERGELLVAVDVDPLAPRP